MADFFDRIADPEWLAAEREIAALREAIYLLIDAARNGYITEGDINQAIALAAPSRPNLPHVACIEHMAKTMRDSMGIPYDDWRDYVPEQYRFIVSD